MCVCIFSSILLLASILSLSLPFLHWNFITSLWYFFYSKLCFSYFFVHVHCTGAAALSCWLESFFFLSTHLFIYWCINYLLFFFAMRRRRRRLTDVNIYDSDDPRAVQWNLCCKCSLTSESAFNRQSALNCVRTMQWNYWLFFMKVIDFFCLRTVQPNPFVVQLKTRSHANKIQ